MSREYWEQRYQTKDMPWEKGAPSPGLVDFLTANPNLSRGSVCVPGCGTGHDVRTWAAAGFQAHGIDIAPSAVRLAKAATAAAGLTNASFENGDFLTTTPPRRFDWLFEHTLFCAINPEARNQYTKAVISWLKPGGNFLAVHYLIPDEEGPPFGTTREELLARFSPFFNLIQHWVPRSYPNRTGLELMMWWERKGDSTT
jgi:methyl halide transferase